MEDLQELIHEVRSRVAGADSLAHLRESVATANELSVRADALVGFFVDQARASGAPWSEIGASLGVTKQAAQKRFVVRFDGGDPIPEARVMARLTDRSRNVIDAASRIAELEGIDAVTSEHIAAALPSEAEGLAAVILSAWAVTSDVLGREFGVTIRKDPREKAVDAEVPPLRFSPSGNATVQAAAAAARRLGANFIGTEHLLLGILNVECAAASFLTASGVTAAAVEQANAEFVATVLASARG